MRVPPQIRWLPDSKRLHLSDGPIDLIVEAFGDPAQMQAAYRAASARFITVLDELCSELPLLRQPVTANSLRPTGIVARRMSDAVAPYARRCFITPMAAVAGSVAEEILGAMTTVAHLDRAYINNGGDIALHIAPQNKFVVGMIERPDRPSLFGTATLDFGSRVRGIATSGWRGRSFSLGMADAVTVLATTASSADAAATIIANAVDLPGHPAIVRTPANRLAPDTDLGALLVTRSVGPLTHSEIQEALASGARVAQDLLAGNLIVSAALCLQGHTRVIDSTQNLTVHSDSRSLAHA